MVYTAPELTLCDGSLPITVREFIIIKSSQIILFHGRSVCICAKKFYLDIKVRISVFYTPTARELIRLVDTFHVKFVSFNYLVLQFREDYGMADRIVILIFVFPSAVDTHFNF